MAEPAERLGILENRMDRVEEGVANFRQFQVDARDFFTEHRTNELRREEFQNKRDQEIKDTLIQRHQKTDTKMNILMVIIAALTLLLGWLALRDTEQKNSFASPVPGISYSQPPQEGKLPK